MIADDKRDDLACASTHYRPKPTLMGFVGDEGPGLIDLQHIPKLDRQQCFGQPGKGGYMLLNPSQNGLTMRAEDALDSA